MTARACIFVCLFLGLIKALAGNPDEHCFLWNEANARMESARTSEDALQAAGSYARLLDAGVRNGALFQNLGTALLMAGRNVDAVNMFLRAERYEGAQPDIMRNLQIAIARQEKHGSSGTYWGRVLLFWHYPLPARQRGLVAVASFFAFWVALSIQQWLRVPGTRIIAVLALVIFIAFGTSFMITLYQENSARPLSFAPVQADKH